MVEWVRLHANVQSYVVPVARQPQVILFGEEQ